MTNEARYKMKSTVRSARSLTAATHWTTAASRRNQMAHGTPNKRLHQETGDIGAARRCEASAFHWSPNPPLHHGHRKDRSLRGERQRQAASKEPPAGLPFVAFSWRKDLRISTDSTIKGCQRERSPPPGLNDGDYTASLGLRNKQDDGRSKGVITAERTPTTPLHPPEGTAACVRHFR
ncbi:hypothetical protein M3Y99_00857200 [Aphelenchoides fujianensis]|nr:hypothetical protein M3Y99_00857200 [Aphelenchoides fujianensis]